MTLPLFKWKGGKQKLLPQMIPYFPQNVSHLVEPFLGGGTVRGHFGNSVTAYLSDTNYELVNTYHVIRDRPQDLITALVGYKQKHSEKFYYQVRANQPENLDFVGKAARFLYLNKTCFNGLYRVNQKGQFNVPKGDNDSPEWDSDQILVWADLLKGDMIWKRDFEQVNRTSLQPESFVYFDPPYWGTSDMYTKNSFTWEDQVRLARFFRRLTDQGIKAMLSNSDTVHTRTLYKNFNVYTLSRNGTVGVGDRSNVNEILVTNYAN